jgi:hypothetical protein
MRATTACSAAVVLFALTAAPLRAQTPDFLIGFSALNNLRSVDPAACAVLAQCPVPMPAIAGLPPWAGGNGWDPVRPGTWVTNGLQLAKFSDACALMCPPQPIPTLGPNAFATGLEVVESQNQIWLIDSLGILHFYSNTCPAQPLGVCNTGLAPMLPQTYTSGLAVDEGNGYVFVAHCDFLTGANFIAVSPLNNPCAVVCRVPVPPCTFPFGTIRGLTVNWGRRVLYATDGFNTLAMRYTVGTPCVQFVGFQCCPLPVLGPDPMVGLALRPGQATSMGAGCANGTCPPCPMVHSLGNDPNLGNAAFHLRLDQAAIGSLAWCLIGSGPCAAPGVLPPPLCGPVFAATPLLGTLGPNVLGPSSAVCGGSTAYPFPLPPAPGLAGWVISSQCVALCSSALGTGTAVSNCLSFMLQGN